MTEAPNSDLDGLREGARSGGGQKERLRSALVIAEIIASNRSERAGRMIDHDAVASMERKKQEGYF